jgi:hypothetical protein
MERHDQLTQSDLSIYKLLIKKNMEGNAMGILPEGEQLRRAVKWISDERLLDSGVSRKKLIGEACLKFDLPPKDAEFLMSYFADKNSE